MAVSVTRSGPYYSTGSISFSSLRNNFRAQNIDGTFNSDSLPIKASELRRKVDINEENAVVPDSVENENISTLNNLNLSDFRGSVKFYKINQSGTDDNNGNNTSPGVNLSTLSNFYWIDNLGKNIKKDITISGTVGSYYTIQPALSLIGSLCNVTFNVTNTGKIYGAGGQYGINSGKGGDAFELVNNISNTVYVNLTSTSRIWAGGGAGGRGGDGGDGGTGGTGGSYPLSQRNPGSGGLGGNGGNGGNGRGYEQVLSNGLSGSLGSNGSSGETLAGSDSGTDKAGTGSILYRFPQHVGDNSKVTFSSGNGGAGGRGGAGGSGGDWGQSGNIGNSGDSGITGLQSSSALFLRVVNTTSGIGYTGSYSANHTNKIYIRSLIDIEQGGNGSFSETISNSVSSGYYGPVESYDLNISVDSNPNGIYATGSSTYIDDNGAAGDDADDLVLNFDEQNGNVFFIYTSFNGTDGEQGEQGTEGGLSGRAIFGTNTYEISGPESVILGRT
jgi:hypothetical protein